MSKYTNCDISGLNLNPGLTLIHLWASGSWEVNMCMIHHYRKYDFPRTFLLVYKKPSKQRAHWNITAVSVVSRWQQTYVSINCYRCYIRVWNFAIANCWRCNRITTTLVNKRMCWIKQAKYNIHWWRIWPKRWKTLL